MTTTRTPSWAEYNAWELAQEAGVGNPDWDISPGADFLYRVKSNLLDAVEEGYAGPDDLHEIADQCVNIYTHQCWQEFVDICAYEEEPELGTSEDLTRTAMSVMYQIAHRLCDALLAIDNPCDDDVTPD